VFEETQSYWTGPIIDVQMAANARIARINTSNRTNPEFAFSDIAHGFTLGESAAYIMILGDRVSGTVNKTWVEYLFGKLVGRRTRNFHQLDARFER
jgi:hypothetical protein